MTDGGEGQCGFRISEEAQNRRVTAMNGTMGRKRVKRTAEGITFLPKNILTVEEFRTKFGI